MLDTEDALSHVSYYYIAIMKHGSKSFLKMWESFDIFLIKIVKNYQKFMRFLCASQ